MCRPPHAGQGYPEDVFRHSRSEADDFAALIKCTGADPLGCPMSRKLLCFGDNDSFVQRVEALRSAHMPDEPSAGSAYGPSAAATVAATAARTHARHPELTTKGAAGGIHGMRSKSGGRLRARRATSAYNPRRTLRAEARAQRLSSGLQLDQKDSQSSTLVQVAQPSPSPAASSMASASSSAAAGQAFVAFDNVGDISLAFDESQVTSCHTPRAVARPAAGQEADKCLALQSEQGEKDGESVLIHLYDLSDAIAHVNAVALDILGLGGALHVGVEVLGAEWSFGMQGVSVTTPRQNQYYAYRQSVPMGKTCFRPEEVESAIRVMKGEWLGSEYNLLTRNCGTFCNALCLKLGVGSLPAWVTRLAETMAKMPVVRRLTDILTRTTPLEDDALAGSTPTIRKWPPQQLCDLEDDEEEAALIAYELQNEEPLSPGQDKLWMLPMLAAESPVRAWLTAPTPRLGSPQGHQMLPRKRCEAFRVDHSQEHAAGAGAGAGLPGRGADGAGCTDKYGGCPQQLRGHILARARTGGG